MKEKEVGVKESFYQAVADLLKCDDHIYVETFRKKTRWNNRQPGNGRFKGHGLVRYYGPSYIHVVLTSPPLSGVFASSDQVLEAIKKVMPN